MRNPSSISGIIISLIGIALFVSPVSGQQADNITYSLSSDTSTPATYKIIYDLQAPYDNIPCQVKVKFTSSEGSFYLNEVTGDVGDLVYPGLKKLITWNYVDELIHFSGDINLSIEVTPSVQVASHVKRGKQLAVQLAPGFEANKTYAAKLYQNSKEIHSLNEVSVMDKSFKVLIPKNTSVKKNYQVVITDGEKTFFSNTFRVKPIIGYGWKAAAVLAVPAFIIINKYIEDNESLPGPPSHN